MEDEIKPDLNILLSSLSIKETEKIDINLLKMSLTHKSTKILFDSLNYDNERLEYLGDAVLKLTVSELLYKNYPEANEGTMSQVRAYVVSDRTLARIAKKINLGNYIFLGKKEFLSGGRGKSSILANCLEALMGAIFLSTDFNFASKIITTLVTDELKKAIQGKAEEENPKDTLQKITQARYKKLPDYKSSHLEGPPHNAVFQCFLTVEGKEYYGTGSSKKEAEKNAAKLAIKDIKKDEK